MAYSYRRYSSSGQRDGTSLERQLEQAQAVCNDKGWTLVDLPPDEGIPGYKGINKIKGTLGQFINKVKAGNIPKGSVLKKFAPRTVSHPEINKELREGLSKMVTSNVIRTELKDNETRKRLLNLIPSLVKGLIVDTTKHRYAVVSHNGSQSEWRKV